MKKGFCFRSVKSKREQDKRLRMIKEAGYDGIEISTLEKAADRRAMKKAADTHDLEIHSIMASGHWTYPLSSPKKSVRKKGLDNIRKSVDTAAAVGASAVLVVPGVVTEEVPYETAYKFSSRSMKELAPYAKSAGVVLAVENVWNKFLLSPLEFVRFIDAVKNKAVAAYFDVGNIVVYGFPEQWIRSLGRRLKKVHVKGFDMKTRNFCYLLEGTIDWQAVRKALVDIRYKGYLTVEMDPYPYAPYGDQMLKDASAHLDRIIAGR